MTRAKVKPSIDGTAPPPGVKLNVGAVMAKLGVSFTDLQLATGLSRGAAWNLVAENRWPVGYEADDIKRAAADLLAARGASPLQLATLWHAYRRCEARSLPDTTNVRGQALEGPPRPVPPAPPRPVPIPPIARRSSAKGKPSTEPKDTDMLLAKQTLTAAARKQFALFSNPFDGEVTCSEEMYTNAEIRFVREACWQAATGGRFVAVVGESGSGKTTLLADLKERIHTDRKPVVVIEPSVLGMEETDSRGKVLKAGDILTAIVMTLQPGISVAQTSEKRTRQAEQLLAASTMAGNSHLLLIEEAHALPIPTLKHLKRLHERMRLNGRKPMIGILLLGQPELMATLSDSRHEVREVVQRVEMVQLQPLDHELAGYLTFRAKAAGRELDTLMDAPAVDALRARLTVLRQGVRNSAVSLVYPLAVNNLVTAALNKAVELGEPMVSADVVRAL
jgi:type II secretory pathway predicted ATPase ExeA